MDCDRDIIRGYQDGATMEAVGRPYGLSRQRVQQILIANGVPRRAAQSSRETREKARWTFWQKALRGIVVVDGCWIWPSVNNRGYGHFGQEKAHREVWEFLIGPIPDGFTIDHKCRVTACVNPAHLEPVTHAENCRRGVNARLTHEDAQVIRESSDTQRDLAKRYGVAQSLIGRIKTGKAWVR